MNHSRAGEQPLGELIDVDLPAGELARLARVDALLRTASARDRDGAIVASGDGRDCERIRASISAALDGELSELESIRARKHVEHCPSCAGFQADAERLAAALRTTPPEPVGRPLAVPLDGGSAFPMHERRRNEEPLRANLRLVATPTTTGSTEPRRDDQAHALRLTFGQLALVYKSLQAVKTLGALPPQAELLNDTIQLVDLAMKEAV
jgi:Putative zinc-finger